MLYYFKNTCSKDENDSVVQKMKNVLTAQAPVYLPFLNYLRFIYFPLIHKNFRLFRFAIFRIKKENLIEEKECETEPISLESCFFSSSK